MGQTGPDQLRGQLDPLFGGQVGAPDTLPWFEAGYGFGIWGDGTLFLSKIGINAVRSAAQVAAAGWHHVAVTKHGSSIVFYVDGTAYQALPYYDEFGFGTRVAIGARGDNYGGAFNGLIDEVSVYGRRLSAAEVAAIFAAGGSGKCLALAPPQIYTQPQSQTVVVGTSASLNVLASMRPPAGYQWRRANVELVGQTDAGLSFAAVEVSDGGSYSVVVSNSLGSVTSCVAVLQVLLVKCPVNN